MPIPPARTKPTPVDEAFVAEVRKYGVEQPARVVLADGECETVIRAAAHIVEQGVARPVLVGKVKSTGLVEVEMGQHSPDGIHDVWWLDAARDHLCKHRLGQKIVILAD